MITKLSFLALIAFFSTSLVAQEKSLSCQNFYEKDLKPAYTLDKDFEAVLTLKAKAALALVEKIKSIKLDNNTVDDSIANFKKKCATKTFKEAKNELLVSPACFDMGIDLDFYSALLSAKWNDSQKKQIKESVFQFINNNLILQNGRPVDYLIYASVLSKMTEKGFITDEKQKASIKNYATSTEVHLKNKDNLNTLKTCSELSKYLDEHIKDRSNDQKQLKEIIAL